MSLINRMSIDHAPAATGIYRIACVPTGECYIGAAVDMQKRAYQHATMLALGNHHSKSMQAAFKSHGPSNFKFDVIDRCDLAELSDRERAWIARLSPALNEMSGGRQSGLTVGRRVRRRRSEVLRSKPNRQKPPRISRSDRAMPYESVKIYEPDYHRAHGIRAERGLPVIEALGCALEGWNKLSKRQQDQIIRERASRKHGSADAPRPAVACA